MRRREFMTLFGAAAVRPLAAHAQQPAKLRRVGYLDYGAGILPSGGFAPFYETYRRKPFLEGLRQGGWVEGQNVTIERRFAAGQANRLPALAAELVALNVDVMLAAATPGSQGCAERDQQDRHRDGRPRRRGAARACRQPCAARSKYQRG